MHKSFKLLTLAGVLSLLLTYGCGQGGPNNGETPTSGNIKIAVDESFKLLSEAELDTFLSFYESARIQAIYKPEADVIDLFMKDSVRNIITARPLTKNEENQLMAKQFYPKSVKIAYDALAFIVNKENPDAQFGFGKLKDIFTGKITHWKQLDPKSKLDKIAVVFDNNKSSNIRYIREKFGLNEAFSPACFAVNSNEEVIGHVERNPGSIGVIGVNWISDTRDTVSHNFLGRVAVAGISSEGDPEGTGTFYKPYQGYIADNSYPLIREIYIISRETFPGLGTGFASFVAGEKGQRIVLRSGLVPATMPVRLVEIKH